MSANINRFLSTEEDTFSFSAALAKAIDDGAIIFMQGQLGAGKTTFTRGFLRALGIQDKIKSPTYTLVEPYEIANKNIFHFDFYRLHDANELEHLGLREYFAQQNICIIEWPEIAMSLIPEPDLICLLQIANNGREIKMSAHTPRGEKIIKRLLNN